MIEIIVGDSASKIRILKTWLVEHEKRECCRCSCREDEADVTRNDQTCILPKALGKIISSDWVR